MSPLHGTQVPVPRSQSGAPDGHCMSFVQPQSPVDTLQIGLVPVQSEPFVAEHCAQAPFPWQAGFAGDAQARDAPDPLSPLHPAHVPVEVSQRGEVPEH